MWRVLVGRRAAAVARSPGWVHACTRVCQQARLQVASRCSVLHLPCPALPCPGPTRLAFSMPPTEYSKNRSHAWHPCGSQPAAATSLPSRPLTHVFAEQGAQHLGLHAKPTHRRLQHTPVQTIVEHPRLLAAHALHERAQRRHLNGSREQLLCGTRYAAPHHMQLCPSAPQCSPEHGIQLTPTPQSVLKHQGKRARSRAAPLTCVRASGPLVSSARSTET